MLPIDLRPDYLDMNKSLVFSNVGNSFYVGETYDINISITITEQRILFPGGSHVIHFDDGLFVILPDEYSKYGINV